MNPVLRSAQSTPYIRSSPNDIVEKENSNDCLEVRRQDLSGVQFNAGGCSSSSSDLSQFMEIYNDLGENPEFGERLLQYKRQKGQDSKFEGYLSDSCGNLITPQSCSTQSVCEDQITASNHVNNLNHIYRSMDVLPTIKEAGFYALEKCVSIDFPPKNLIPPSKLIRSKEMDNILVEDDYE